MLGPFFPGFLELSRFGYVHHNAAHGLDTLLQARDPLVSLFIHASRVERKTQESLHFRQQSGRLIVGEVAGHVRAADYDRKICRISDAANLYRDGAAARTIKLSQYDALPSAQQHHAVPYLQQQSLPEDAALQVRVGVLTLAI